VTRPPRTTQVVTLSMAFAVLTPAGRAAEPPSAPESVTPSAAPDARAGVEDLYRIGPGDQLDIRFFFQPELDAKVTVRPDGRVSLQLVGDVGAAGRTVPELRDALTRAYAGELLDPTITVILAASGARVYVDGEVGRPGALPYVHRMSVLEAVAEAGGLRDTAGGRHILVIRRSAPGGAPTVLQVNYGKALHGAPGPAVDLLPSDIVYVPRSNIAKVNRWVDQYLRKNIPIPLTLGWYRGI
jgi:polysaccharide export outer membrane protein